MDIRKHIRACSTLSIPYRYDLRTGRDSGVSSFVDNGLLQSFGGTQGGSSANHEGLSVDYGQSNVSCERDRKLSPV